MSRTFFSFPVALFLAGSLLLAGSRRGTALGQNGMTGTPQGSTTSSRSLEERGFAGALLTDLRAETRLSKLALKNSSDPQVKTVARRVISENRKFDAQLETLISSDSAVNTEAYNFGHLSAQSRQEVRELHNLKGTDFDKAYAHAMEQYGRGMQTLVQNNSTLLTDSRLQRLAARMQANSEDNMAKLRQAVPG